VSAHIGLDELADAAGGVLDHDRVREIDAHLQECDECRDSYVAVTGVSALLAADPAPAMPPEIAQRLTAVLEQESRLRSQSMSSPSAGSAGSPTGPANRLPRPSAVPLRPSLGSFGADLPHRSRGRLLLTALAACALAGAVGFTGYVLSAAAGLNEPPGTAPAVVSSGRLGPEARSIEQRSDLSPHRFSQAWQCARQATDGRITAITSAVVDGQPALLVYLEDDGRSSVTVVTGCDAGRPVPGPSTTLPR
jgi:hypothetical protein